MKATVCIPSLYKQDHQSLWKQFHGISIFFVAFIVLAIGLAGCSDDNKESTQSVSTADSNSTGKDLNKEIIYATENDLVNLDPTKSLDIYTLQVTGQVMEGLVGLNEKNQLTPLLAESWSANEDNTTWTFKIRKGVYFHENQIFGPERTRQVNAEDVRYSFERLVAKDAVQSFALADIIQGAAEFNEGKTPNVSGIRVVDPYTVEFHLLRPDPSFVNRITSPWFPVMAKEAVELGADKYGRNVLIGTGPFRLVSRSDTEVVLEKNSRYWRKHAGNVTKIRFTVIKNEQIRMTELKNNKISIMQLPIRQAPAVRDINSTGHVELKQPYKGRFVIAPFKTFNSHLIGFNTLKIDRHLRRAISFAINRDEIVRTVINNEGNVLSGPVPNGMPGYPSMYTKDIYDQEKARNELEQSGFDVKTDSVELLVNDRENSEQIGVLIQNQLKKIGITVRLVKVDFNSAISRIVTGKTVMFSMFFEYVFSSPDQVLNNMFSSAKIPVPNFWQYRSQVVDDGLKKMAGLKDPAQRRELAVSLEDTIIEDAPAAFLFQLNNELIWSNRLSNVYVNGHNIPLLWRINIRE